MAVVNATGIITKAVKHVSSTNRVTFIHSETKTIRFDTSTVVSETTHFIGESEQNVKTVVSFVVSLGPITPHGLSLPRSIVTMVRAFAIEFPVSAAMPFANRISPPEFDVFQNLTPVSHSARKTRKIVTLPKRLAIALVAMAAP